VEEAVGAVTDVGRTSHSDCRRIFEERSSVERMTDDYLKVYQQLLRSERNHDSPVEA
jgi:hypothetical protein